MIISQNFYKKSFPDNLKPNGRQKLSSDNFASSDRLFRSFKKSDLDEDNILRLETIKFPDISCNWERFSKPEDIWFRNKGSAKDGCYSITVEDSRFEKIATPVHDPILRCSSDEIENYSHTEIRVLQEGKELTYEPEKKRKLNNKQKKLEYRMHIREMYKVELKAW